MNHSPSQIIEQDEEVVQDQEDDDEEVLVALKPAASFGTEPEDQARSKAEELTSKIEKAAKLE